MANPLQVTLGRKRVTRAVVQPSEAGYIKYMREQTKAIEDNLKSVVTSLENATAQAIVFGLQPIFDKSQIYVPVDTGRLKRSGFIETRKTSTGVEAAIGYGRFGQPFYTAMVHERMDFHHAPPTRAKFLEAAVNEHLQDFRRRVELFMKREAGEANL